MPAHFTSSAERSQTFLISYDDITENDEYEMASQAWNNVPSGLSETDTAICLRTGEDIMVGCFILTKMGHGVKSDKYRAEIELINSYESNEIAKPSQVESIISYFDFCENYGRKRAL